MSVLVRIGARKAVLRDGKWLCADAETEARLNEATESWIAETGGPPIADNDPERTVANTIGKLLGGRVLLHVPANPQRSRKLYFDRRQLGFNYTRRLVIR